MRSGFIHLCCGWVLLLSGILFAEEIPDSLPLFRDQSDLDASVHPLGWTEDGTKLAVLIVHPWEAADSPAFELQILNLVDDTVVHSQKWQDLNLPDLAESFSAGVAQFWGQYETLISAACDKYGILRRKTWNYQQLPGFADERRGIVVSTELRQVRAPHPLGVLGGTSEGIESLELDVILSGTRKTIHRASFGETGVHPLAAQAVGFLTNPQRDRLAIVLVRIEAGWEGAPHPRRIQWIGCRLDSTDEVQ